MNVATMAFAATAVDDCVATTVVSKMGETTCNGITIIITICRYDDSTLNRSKQNSHESDCQTEHVHDVIVKDGLWKKKYYKDSYRADLPYRESITLRHEMSEQIVYL